MQCSDPKVLWVDNKDDDDSSRQVTVPCGKCLVCLSKKRQDWAFRLQQEYRHSKSAHFVTLTYNRQSLKLANYELKKRDLQNYFKRLRKLCPSKIRYYAVGEYGTRTGRPHYHAIIFNCDEESIRKAWSLENNPLGIVHVGTVTQASIAYCLKYVVQPFEQSKKPFAVMSRGYGLGAKYLTDEMVQWHRSNMANYAYDFNVQVRLPRFYKEKIFYGDLKEKVAMESKWSSIKSKREELRVYVKKYGVDKAKDIMAGERKALLQRIKIKVQFSQTF